MSTPTETELPEVLRHALQNLNVGVAVADGDSWQILFENARFFEWFAPVTDEDSLQVRLGEQDWEKARSRLGEGRQFSYETDVGSGARTVNLEVVLRPTALDERRLLLVEVFNASKRKQAEYMLDSYSQMAERNARDLQREKERGEKLLLNIMPRAVYEELRDFGSTTPQRFDAASILMLDFGDRSSGAAASASTPGRS
jgi:adenylate cyclase